MTKRILVADDDEAVRKAFRLALDGSEYQVDTVESGDAAIEKARASRYDLAFLDLKMPGLDGIAVLRRLRRIDPNLPVYIATGFHAESTDRLRRASARGLRFEVVEKPIATEEIASLVKAALSNDAQPQPGRSGVYEFRLYLLGGGEHASRAANDLEMLLKNKFGREYSLRVIDVLDNPDAAERDSVYATPTVVRIRPKPSRHVVGSLSDGDEVLRMLADDNH